MEATLHGDNGDCMIKVIDLKGYFVESTHIGLEGSPPCLTCIKKSEHHYGFWLLVKCEMKD